MTRVEEIATETAGMLISFDGSANGTTAISLSGIGKEGLSPVDFIFGTVQADPLASARLVQLMGEILERTGIKYRGIGRTPNNSYPAQSLAHDLRVPDVRYYYSPESGMLNADYKKWREYQAVSPQVFVWTRLDSDNHPLKLVGQLVNKGIQIPLLLTVFDERDEPHQPLGETPVAALTTTEDVLNHPLLIERFPHYRKQIDQARKNMN